MTLAMSHSRGYIALILESGEKPLDRVCPPHPETDQTMENISSFRVPSTSPFLFVRGWELGSTNQSFVSLQLASEKSIRAFNI